jgi:hypothetical protein
MPNFSYGLTPQAIVDVPSSALISTATTGAFIPAFEIYEVNVPVTAVSGTPTLDLSIEESDDNGVNWFKVYDFPRITATGIYRSPKLVSQGNRIRYVQTVGGGTPSLTRSINRLQSTYQGFQVRQLIDRTISLTTLSSTTPSINVQNCDNFQLVISLGAATTGPTVQLQGSDDNGATWYLLGTPLLGVANSSVQTTVTLNHSQLLRAIVTIVGVAVTPNYVLLKGF